MANLARRLDRLERLAHELLNARPGPVYFREGSQIPADIDVDRVIWIKRILLDPPEQREEQLPEIVEPSPAIERAAPPSFHRAFGSAAAGNRVMRAQGLLSKNINEIPGQRRYDIGGFSMIWLISALFQSWRSPA